MHRRGHSISTKHASILVTLLLLLLASMPLAFAAARPGHAAVVSGEAWASVVSSGDAPRIHETANGDSVRLLR